MDVQSRRRWYKLQQDELRKVFLGAETKTNERGSAREKGDTLHKFNVSVRKQEINEIISQGTIVTACPLDTCHSASLGPGVQMLLPLIRPGNITAQGHLPTNTEGMKWFTLQLTGLL